MTPSSALIAKLIERMVSRIGLNRAIENTGLTASLTKAQINQSPSEMLAVFVYWFIFLNFILVALESLGLSTAVEQLQRFIALTKRYSTRSPHNRNSSNSKPHRCPLKSYMRPSAERRRASRHLCHLTLQRSMFSNNDTAKTPV